MTRKKINWNCQKIDYFQKLSKNFINIFRPSPTIYFFKIFFLKNTSSKIQYIKAWLEKFESNKSISDFNQTDWEQILCSEKSDVNFSMNQYLSKIDRLLETYAPLKKLNRKELKFLTKPWIKQDMQNSTKKKNNIYSKFVKCKNQKLKEF